MGLNGEKASIHPAQTRDAARLSLPRTMTRCQLAADRPWKPPLGFACVTVRRIAGRVRRALHEPVSELAEYDDSERIAAAVARIQPHTMVGPRALATLWQQVTWVDRRRVPGALVECGVWHGGAAALMAQASLSSGTPRRLHLFDSFEGIPDAEPGDGDRAIRETGGTATGALSVAYDYADRGGPGSPTQVSGLLARIGYPLERVEFHVGWFQDTVPASDTGVIAVLRLDGDLYASTKVCLEGLYPRVAPGGIVVIDDYGAYDGCRSAVDEYLSANGSPYLHHVDVNARYIVKPA